jgi:putative membrane protein
MLVINTLIILIASSLVRGFWVENFWWAMLFSMALAFVTAVFRTLAEKKS